MDNNGKIIAICICPVAGDEMQLVNETEAIAGAGLKGDRYCIGKGSFNRDKIGNRQVTLINGIFFQGTGFEFVDSRRNIVTADVELMFLIGKEFKIGNARMRGIKYCDPCNRPSKISGKPGFRDAFQDRGGLVAEIIESGIIKVGDLIIPPPKGY
jgi:hypothetical protein